MNGKLGGKKKRCWTTTRLGTMYQVRALSWWTRGRLFPVSESACPIPILRLLCLKFNNETESF